MDFTFSAEQDALRDAVRAFLADWSAHVATRATGSTRRRLAARWSSSAGPACSSPSEHGGLGLGLVDAVVVLEEMGRVAVPGSVPLVARSPPTRPRRLGLDDLARGARRGRSAGTVALEESGHGDPVDRVRTRARRAGAPLDAHRREADRARRSRRRLGPRRGAHRRRARARSASTRPTIEPVPTMDPTRACGAPRARRDAGRAGRTAGRPHRDLAGGRRRHRGRARGGAHRRVRRVDRDGDRLRRAARAVRQADRVAPGDPAQARRHAPRHRARSGRRALRGVGVRRRRRGRGRAPRRSPRRRWARPR